MNDPDKDYSQFGEQAAILRYFDGKHPSVFLDVGAWDGVENSNTRALALRDWRGVVIDPNPFAAARLAKLYGHAGSRVVVYPVAVMPDHDRRDVVDLLASEGEGLSTTLLSHAKAWNTLPSALRVVVPAIGFDDALRFCEDMHGVPPEFVSIDVEGQSLDVCDFEAMRGCNVELVCVEVDYWIDEHAGRGNDRELRLISDAENNGYKLYWKPDDHAKRCNLIFAIDEDFDELT